jgi:hypothetical protein
MTPSDLNKLKYPIGIFTAPTEIDNSQIMNWIQELEEFPSKLRQLVEMLTDSQLDTAYRPGGWTVRQLIHHLADSHTHSYIRFKWALTEEKPVIKAYDENSWAAIFDSNSAPIYLALDYLHALHARMVYLLRGLNSDQLDRTFIHPESGGEFSVKETIGNYVWHGKHHLAHIQNLMQREGWI